MISRRLPGPLSAFVLHRWDWSETSLILDLFIRELGRVVVAAKGAKRPHSQWRPLLLPLQAVMVQLSRAPSDEAEVLSLRSAEWAGGAPMPGGGALLSGLYLNELLMKLLPRDDPHPLLFDAYSRTLAGLAAAGEGTALAALRAFELVLLREAGLLPELQITTLARRPVQAAGHYALQPEGGVIEAAGEEAQALTGATLIALHEAMTDTDPAALQRACATHAAALRAPLRALLHYHLGTPSLRTRDIVLDMQRLVAQTRHAPAET